jgi:hypothetical protein
MTAPNPDVVKIDYTAHPHIVERILDLSPKSALDTWRLTSKALKKRAESTLAKYTVSARPPYKPRKWWCKPCGTEPKIGGPLKAPSLLDPKLRVLDVDMRTKYLWGVFSEANAAINKLSNLELVRVYKCGVEDDLEPNVNGLRRPGDLPPAHTVHFYHFHPSRAEDFRAFPFPLGGGDIFVHVRFDNAPPDFEMPPHDTSMYRPWNVGGLYKRDIYGSPSNFYIFMTTNHHPSGTKHPLDKSWRTCMREFADSVARELVEGSPANFVFVGDPDSFGTGDIAGQTERRIITKYIACFIKDHYDDWEHISWGLKRLGRGGVKFMTFEEMRGVVGEELYEFIMIRAVACRKEMYLCRPAEYSLCWKPLLENLSRVYNGCAGALARVHCAVRSVVANCGMGGDRARAVG